MVKGTEFIKKLDNSLFSDFQFLFFPLLDSGFCFRKVTVLKCE